MARFSQMMLRGMLDPSRSQRYSQVGQSIGQAPGIMRLNEEAEKRKQEMANIYSTAMSPTSTAEQMSAAAQQLLAQGKVEEAMELAKQARERMQQQTAATQLQALQETIVDSANKLGMEDLAERALNTTDEETLRAIQKDLRAFERKEVIRLRGIPGRKALARNMGIEWNDETMSNMSDEAFNKLLEGSEAELKAFVTADGKEMMLEVDSRGRVMDPDSGRFVRASEIGLRRAPNRQQVETIANYTSELLAEAGVKHFQELHESTSQTIATLNNIEEVLPLTDEMITGATAQPELFVRRIRSELSEALGIDASDPALQNTEAYIALAAPRVAEIIKNFGAGTGLSDADREFANKAAAGDIEMTATSLQRILKILKKAGENKVDLYNRTVKEMKVAPGSYGFVLPSRTKRTPPTTQDVDTVDTPPSGFVRD